MLRSGTDFKTAARDLGRGDDIVPHPRERDSGGTGWPVGSLSARQRRIRTWMELRSAKD
jgi:hypothetical protein